MWLEPKYLEEKLSTGQIAKLCGIDASAVVYWLKKFNIHIRSTSEATHLIQANHCDLSKEAVEWISGELLGDGCLISQSKYSANFGYTSKHLEYIKYISNTLESFGIKQTGKIRKRYDLNIGFTYASLSYVELLPLYKKWYPKGKKIVPKNIELTPLTVRQWHIGDGYLGHRKNRRPYIQLCTCGFKVFDVALLIERLIELGFKTTRQPANNVIYISTHSIKKFFDYIGKCPVKCYQYKFNY